MAGEISLSRATLERLGKALVAAVVFEAKKDFAKQGRRATPRGKPEGIPNSDSFFDSFSYRISGKSTIEILSTWPWIDQVVEGRSPYPMTWLTQQNGVYRVPMVQGDGTVLVRTAPLIVGNAWVHPGFARHTFLERGVKRARQEMADIILDEVREMLMQGDPSK